MPKATVEGGASNAAVPEFWVCSACGARYAAGAPRCPECPETAHKVTGSGDEDPAGWHAGDGEGPEAAEPGGAALPEPEGEPVTEAPAPPASPRAPRRTTPADGA